MTLSDPQVYRNIIGCLMQQPTLRLEYEIKAEDFDIKLFQGIFAIISGLVQKGYNTAFTDITLDLEIHSIASPAFISLYDTSNGINILRDCLMVANIDNFPYFFENLKKNALLRKLKKNGYPIDYFFVDTNESFTKDEDSAIRHYNESSLVDIINYYEVKQNEINAQFLSQTKNNSAADEGIQALLKELECTPNIGIDLEGDIFNHVCRGARKGCFYLKSASSGTGKSRTAVFDACRIAYPVRYSLKNEQWEYDLDIETGKIRKPKKTLFIVTEMDKDEIQTIILAYLSRVNEDHILTNTYEIGEKERVMKAAEIMEHYKNILLITAISDPNLVNIETAIKKYAVIDKIEYVFFDYIHSTGSLLSQFSSSGVGEYTMLMMMANELKQLAKDYGLFIMSATQVNAAGMEETSDFKNELCIRGSKAVADKADVAFVISKAPAELFNNIYHKIAGETIRDFTQVTHVIDIYKMRRGRYKNVRIFINLDLGTGEREDLFMLTSENQLIALKELNSVFQKNEFVWRQND